jgi:Flp pilus assembly protein TadD/4-amino-4-deoxy-L-arabinose transferase-like glycosyltransferase
MSPRVSRSTRSRARPDRATAVPEVGAAPLKRVVLQVLSLFVLALVIRILHFVQMRHSLVYEVLICDAWQYDQWAQRIASGEWLGTKVFYQTPLYPYSLAVIYAVFGHSVWAVRGVQAVLGSLACAFIARAGARFCSERVGWLAGLLLALYPPAIFFDGILQKASLDLLLVTSLLYALAVYQSRRRRLALAAAGGLLGLFILNRENAAVLFPILLAWIVWIHWEQSWRTRCYRVLAFGISVFAVLLPVGLRNLYVGGEFLLTTSQMGANFYIGNHRGASGYYESLRPLRGDPRHESDDARLLAEEALGRRLSPAQVSGFWLRRAWADIRDDPVGWLGLLARKAFFTVQSLEIADAESLRNHQEISTILSGLGWPLRFGVLIALSVPGLWWTRRDWRRLWVLYAIAAAFALAVALFYTMARYRYPLVPVAVIFAASGLLGLWDRIRARNRQAVRELAFGLALAVPTAVVCNWPLRQIYDDGMTYFNIGTALLDLNRPRDAMGPLIQAERINPSFAPIHNNLGLASQGVGDLSAARRYFERAIELDPNMSAAHVNLGQVCMRQGDMDLATVHYRKALQLDPLQTAAIRALARVELARGSVAEGVRYLRRAVELEPESAGSHADLGLALLRQGQLADAVNELRSAVLLDAGSTEVANNLAWVLATAPQESIRRSAEALELAGRICKATDYGVPELLDTLAAAHADAGQFDQAISILSRAIDLARRNNKAKLVEEMERRCQLYRERRPFRDAALASKPIG